MSDNGAKPVFDFSRVSRRWNKQFSKSIAKVTRAQITMTRPLPAGADDAAVQAHYDRMEAAIDALETVADEQAALVCEVLVDVPVGWLITGAPDGLDWDDPASLDWVRADKYQEILMQIQTGEAARQAAKN